MDKTTQKIITPPSPDAAVPDIKIPGYKIIRELGHGGMAHVYLAVQESFGREVALKVLSPNLADDEQFSKRFLREARIVSQLNHPNIVTVYDAGKQGKHHYMSMEYIPGKDVKQLKDKLSNDDVVRVVKDIARALDYAGSKGFVHRDVKPENIMIHQSDNRVVLMDFGIAYGDDVTQGMTQTGKAIGTPHFMSPEQTKGLQVDHRSDIYSLGVVLFQLLAKRLPFDADSAVAVGIKHLTAPIPLLPAGLEVFQPIINHCLSKEPQHRYQKANEVLHALEKISVDQIKSIDTEATQFRQSGKDHNTETQLTDTPAIKGKKIPEIVFPSQNNKITFNTNEQDVRSSSLRRNLLFILFISSALWVASERQKELTEYWAYNVLPQVVKAYPNVIPESYVSYWAEKKEQAENLKKKNIKMPAVKTEVAKVPVEVTEEEIISNLKITLDNTPKNAIELNTLYNKRLLENKDDLIATSGLLELKDWHLKKIGLAYANEDALLARRFISQAGWLFPDSIKEQKFIRLNKKVTFLEKLSQHFVIANKHFNAGALSKPLEHNALFEIETILSLSPNNEDAVSFKNKIINAYLEKTSQLHQQGNTHNAILMVEEGIAALNSPLLVDKRKQLKETLKINKDIASLFKKASKYIKDSQLIKPRAYNAYDVYQQILEKDKDNLEAKAGLKSIHQQLAKKMTAAINKGNIELSSEYLKQAIQRYGRSALLAAVELKLKDTITEQAPQIITVKLSQQPVTDLISNNKALKTIQTLKLYKTLYVGFNYKNFDISNTWLDAKIIDKTKKITLALKPVVISTQSGEHYFEIKLPTQSFRQHQYKVVLKLKNRVLVSKSFLVRK
ncbi:MAG: serine/threonine-protein kinase [Woeseiaceae bacterium]